MASDPSLGRRGPHAGALGGRVAFRGLRARGELPCKVAEQQGEPGGRSTSTPRIRRPVAASTNHASDSDQPGACSRVARARISSRCGAVRPSCPLSKTWAPRPWSPMSSRLEGLAAAFLTPRQVISEETEGERRTAKGERRRTADLQRARWKRKLVDVSHGRAARSVRGVEKMQLFIFAKRTLICRDLFCSLREASVFIEHNCNVWLQKDISSYCLAYI